jgi:hypothetical protein
MTDLSPQAQAVRAAALATYDESIPKDDNLWALDRASVVAALRAAADQVENVHPANPSTEWGEGWLEGVQDVVAGFRRIAAELEGANG